MTGTQRKQTIQKDRHLSRVIELSTSTAAVPSACSAAADKGVHRSTRHHLCKNRSAIGTKPKSGEVTKP